MTVYAQRRITSVAKVKQVGYMVTRRALGIGRIQVKLRPRPIMIVVWNIIRMEGLCSVVVEVPMIAGKIPK